MYANTRLFLNAWVVASTSNAYLGIARYQRRQHSDPILKAILMYDPESLAIAIRRKKNYDLHRRRCGLVYT